MKPDLHATNTRELIQNWIDKDCKEPCAKCCYAQYVIWLTDKTAVTLCDVLCDLCVYVNPCLNCEDYGGHGICLSNGGCGKDGMKNETGFTRDKYQGTDPELD